MFFFHFTCLCNNFMASLFWLAVGHRSLHGGWYMYTLFLKADLSITQLSQLVGEMETKSRINHTSLVAAVTQADRSIAVCSRSVIEYFSGVFVLSRRFLELSVSYGGCCSRTEYDLFPFSLFIFVLHIHTYHHKNNYVQQFKYCVHYCLTMHSIISLGTNILCYNDINLRFHSKVYNTQGSFLHAGLISHCLYDSLLTELYASKR